MKNFAKIKFFLDFASILVRLFFSYRKFFFHQRVHKKLNYKYTKFGIPTLTTHRTTSDQTLVVLIPPPPHYTKVDFAVPFGLCSELGNTWQRNQTNIG